MWEASEELTVDGGCPQFPQTEGKVVSLYDSSTIDSGFLSEANIPSCDDMKYKEPSPLLDNKKREAYVRTDSGIISDNSAVITDKLEKLNIEQDTQTKQDSQQWNEFVEKAFLQDEDGDTFLHLAIMQHFLETVFSLIRIAPNSSYLDIRNNCWHSPLHIAVLTSQPIIVRRLVLAGANINSRDRWGCTSLHYAAEKGDLPCILSLLTPFKQSEIQALSTEHHPLQQQPNLDLKNYQGQTSAHLAAKNGHSNILFQLWAYGADLNCREGLGGRTALHYAVQRGDIHLTELLLKHCEVDSETENYAGLTPYQQAFLCNHPIKHSLLDFGCIRRDPLLDDSSDSEEMMGDYTDIKVNGAPVSVSG